MSCGMSSPCCPSNPCCPPAEPCCPPEPCPKFCATPPIKPSKRLIKYIPCCPPEPLCCRPEWVKYTSCPCKLTNADLHIDYNFPRLPAPSCRCYIYQQWIANVGPQVDSNICASLYSSKCEHQAGIKAMPPPYCQPPCPCHCCCPDNTECCE